MEREKIDITRHFDKVIDAMTGRGLLLGAYDAEGKANLMTIGWGSLGSIWGEPIWTVLVRPSRYTYRCIEHSQCFSVNVPGEDLSMACATCGSKSGRDLEKFVACGLTHERGKTVLAPTVAECPVVYECQVVHSNNVEPERLDEGIVKGAYVDDNYHRLYFGRILLAEACPAADDVLAGGV